MQVTAIQPGMKVPTEQTALPMPTAQPSRLFPIDQSRSPVFTLGQPAGRDDAQEKLRDIAVEFVGMAFFAPLLEQARNSPFKVDRFHGGYGEDAFASQLDSQLAMRMARQDRTGLVESIIERYAPTAEKQRQAGDDGVDLNA